MHVPWLLMAWRCKEPAHQQPCYWLCKKKRSLFSKWNQQPVPYQWWKVTGNVNILVSFFYINSAWQVSVTDYCFVVCFSESVPCVWCLSQLAKSGSGPRLVATLLLPAQMATLPCWRTETTAAAYDAQWKYLCELVLAGYTLRKDGQNFARAIFTCIWLEKNFCI